MYGMGQGIRIQGARLLTATTLAFAIALVAQVSHADARSATRAAGGYGDSTAYCHNYTRQIQVESWVYQDHGGPQTLGRQVLLYHQGTKNWFGDRFELYQQDTTGALGNRGTLGRFGIKTATLGVGTFEIWARYWFFTIRGWESVQEFLGACRF